MAFFPIPAYLAEKSFPLWEKGAVPLSRGELEHDIPTLTPVISKPRGNANANADAKEEALSPALLIVPGGGYTEHGFDGGLTDLAESYARRGIAVFILRYRLTSDGYHHPCQLLDAQRAVRTMRAQAANWHLDPQRIAVMGFSAGGHLASMLVTHVTPSFPPGETSVADDAIDKESSRPDAAILVYPVISLMETSGTARNLLGLSHEAGISDLIATPRIAILRTQLSAHLNVTEETPPTLLVHGEDDAIVSVHHSRRMFDALQSAGVASAFHEYPVGKHGFGSFTHDPSPTGWLTRVDEWLHHVAHWRELM